MQKFTPDNWNTSQYKNDDKTAIIGLICDPDYAEDEFSYAITIIDKDNNELFQQEFKSLEQACTEINSRYKDLWDYYDLSVQEVPTGGCGSCSAH